MNRSTAAPTHASLPSVEATLIVAASCLFLSGQTGICSDTIGNDGDLAASNDVHSVPPQDQPFGHVRTPVANLNGHARFDACDGNLTAAELQRIYDHDVVLLIDNSGSMGFQDCPLPNDGHVAKSVYRLVFPGEVSPGCSRWEWCGSEITNLAKIAAAGSVDGLSVGLFASTLQMFPHVLPQDIPKIFKENTPGGDTNLAAAIDYVFKDYLRRRQSGKVKPLAIGILSDGCPQGKQQVTEKIVAAARAMRYPKEIVITFFLVGSYDAAGEQFALDLDNNLTSYGSPYDIVNTVPFSRLTEQGLAKALADWL